MFILLLVFVAALVIGYKVLSHIPSLLHTPLMSSMNALDGVIILGALTYHLATTPARARSWAAAASRWPSPTFLRLRHHPQDVEDDRGEKALADFFSPPSRMTPEK